MKVFTPSDMEIPPRGETPKPAWPGATFAAMDLKRSRSWDRGHKKTLLRKVLPARQLPHLILFVKSRSTYRKCEEFNRWADAAIRSKDWPTVQNKIFQSLYQRKLIIIHFQEEITFVVGDAHDRYIKLSKRSLGPCQTVSVKKNQTDVMPMRLMQ